MSMKVVQMKLEELVPDPNNARIHEEKNLEAIIGSLKQFGQVEPLVVQKGTMRVIGGNGRLEAMKALGWPLASVVVVDKTDKEATALGLALNRTAELAGWDPENLALLTRDLADSGFDLDSIGWNDKELKAIWTPPEPEEVEGSNDDSEGENQHMHSLRLTESQRGSFNSAAFKVRERTGDSTMTDGRALELICADFLAGV